MGEIADALRRATSGRAEGARAGAGAPGHARREPAEAPRLAPAPSEEPRLRIGEGGPPQVVDEPHPIDPAIPREAGPALEAVRQVALIVRAQLEARRARSLAVVSALRDEGKTTTSCNLALALASLSPQREVALLDLDLRRPSLATVLDLEVRSGLEDVLAGEASLDDARVQFQDPPLDVYPTMRPQRHAHDKLSRWRLGELMNALERRYELVVIDTPPTLLVPDARLVLERAAVCVPVARAGVSRVRAFKKMMEVLPRGQVLGTLLNGEKPSARYYQGYDYGEEEAEAASKRERQGEG